MERALSAPGKLFLSGEYAVLWGGTARIAAVEPRCQALVRRRADRQVHLLLESGRLAGQATPLGVNWKGEVPADFHFVARAVDLAFRAHGAESLGFTLALSPSERAADGAKLGIGSSARATVLAAEASRFVLEARFDALKLALVAHASAQGGKGSGGDVAASFAGGVVRYRRYPVEGFLAAAGSGLLTSLLSTAPPVDLWRLSTVKACLAFAFTGESRSTTGLIGDVEARLDAPMRQRFVERSDALGEALEAAVVSGDLVAVREAVEGLRGLLAELGPLETEPMRRIVAIAEAYGCAAKQSGAGGGDGCIVFCPDAEVRASLVEALGARGFLSRPLEISAGLRGEALESPLLGSWLAADEG